MTITYHRDLIQGAGIYPDITPAQYFAEPCPAPAATNSIIAVLTDECAAKAAYRHPAINQPLSEAAKELAKYTGAEVSSGAQSLGSVVHRLALGKGSEYVVGDYDDYRKKEAQEWRDSVLEDGHIPLKPKQYEQAGSMAGVVKEAILTATEGHDYQTEVVIAWQEDNGVWCRAMLDVYVPALNLIIDVKTAVSIADDAIDGAFNRYSYARQSAFYRRGLDAINGSPGESSFDFLFIENEAPWLSRSVDTSEGFRTGATGEIERAIATFGNCLASGEWPGYGRRTASPKPWKVGQWIEDGIEVDVE